MIRERDVLAAIAAVRETWDHAPLAASDVEERIAIRFEEAPPELFRVVATPPACRVFMELGPLPTKASPEQRRWRSAYVHTIAEVDAVLSGLLQTMAEAA